MDEPVSLKPIDAVYGSNSHMRWEYSWYFLPSEKAAFNPNFKQGEMLERGQFGWRYVEDEDYILEGVLGKLLWFEREVWPEDSLENESDEHSGSYASPDGTPTVDGAERGV